MSLQKPKCNHTIFDKQCASCKALKDAWYSKINKDFDDIEKDEDHLKIWSADKFRMRHAGMQNGGWQSKAEYYALATQFLNEYRFERELVKTIWLYHSEGLSAREIAETLKKAKFKKAASQSVIKATIKSLKGKMFDMYLAPKKEYHE